MIFPFVKCTICNRDLDFDKDLVLYVSDHNIRLCEKSKCIKTYKKMMILQKKIQEENVRISIEALYPITKYFSETVLKQFLNDVDKVKENKK